MCEPFGPIRPGLLWGEDNHSPARFSGRWAIFLQARCALWKGGKLMSEKLLMRGNEAVGEGAIRAGCQCFFGYPITPQNELFEYMAKRLPEIGGVFLQTESELSGINMVFGAASGGARCMTSSSGPGFTLMGEGLTALAAAQLPAVVVCVSQARHPGWGPWRLPVPGTGPWRCSGALRVDLPGLRVGGSLPQPGHHSFRCYSRSDDGTGRYGESS